jgi:DNA-binding MarR family transcriptional regulator
MVAQPGPVTNSADPIAWSRSRWEELNQPDADHLAAMASILRTHQLVVANMERTLREEDLSRTAWLTMTTLQMSRNRTRPLGQLSRHLIVHPTTVTMVIDQLERRVYVTRAPHPTDGRTVLATLTSKGLTVVKRANRAMAAAGFGLDGVDKALAVEVARVLGDVRACLGDID